MDEAFETYRRYLFAIAYRMLGSAMDAEDMVQETFRRYQSTPPETITSLKAFLTTILTRLCMDQIHLILLAASVDVTISAVAAPPIIAHLGARADDGGQVPARATDTKREGRRVWFVTPATTHLQWGSPISW